MREICKRIISLLSVAALCITACGGYVSTQAADMETEQVSESTVLETDTEKLEVIETETTTETDTEMKRSDETEAGNRHPDTKEKSSFTKIFRVKNAGGVLRILNLDGSLIEELKEGQEKVFEYFEGSNAPEEVRVEAVADAGFYVSSYVTNWFTDTSGYAAPESLYDINKAEYTRGHYLASAEFNEEFVVSFTNTAGKKTAARTFSAVARAADPDNPSVGDTFTGRSYVVYSGSTSSAYNGTGYIVATSGDFKGEEIIMSTCASGHDYAAPITGQTGTYTITITKVDTSKGLVEGTVYWENDSNSSGYQNLSGTFSYETELEGKIRIQKVSANEGISDKNACYSLEGATFKLTNADTGEVISERLVTDEKGRSQYISLPAGKYIVEEVKAPQGFVLSETTVTVKVKSSRTITYEFENVPANDPISLLLQKIDADTGKSVPTGAGEFVNAEYTVKYYDGQYTSISALNGVTPTRTWVLATNESGAIQFRSARKVSGNDFYTYDGVRVIPLGTITIQETKPPKGYRLDPTVYIQNIKANSTGELITSYQTPESPEEIEKRDIEIIKTSSNPAISDGNREYAFEGAVYGLYRTSDGSEYARVTLDKKGYGKFEQVPYDNYFVLEIEPPKGYAKNETKYPVSTTDYDKFEIIRIPVTDTPQNNLIDLLIEKVDKETGKKEPQGTATLEGAEFTVKYYDVPMSTDPAKAGETALRTWVFATDASGEVKMTEDYKISGDPFYTDLQGEITMPLGTVTIQETKAPKGYLMNNEVFVVQVTSNSKIETVSTYAAPIVPDQIIRGDLRGVKISGGDMKRMAGIPFEIMSVTTGESHIVITDKNGEFNTSSGWNLHSQNTNRGETDRDGVWFGEFDSLDDSKGALLYDTYLIEELPCEANKDRILFGVFEVEVSRNMTTIDLGTLTNEYEDEPEIGTRAVDKESGGHSAYVNETTTIVDEIRYENLVPGAEYIIRGILMDKSTEKPLLVSGKEITAEKSFVAKKANGTIELEFTFDSSVLQGKEIVVFERLYLDEREIVVHEELDDKGQTVKYEDPGIGTTATDKETGEQDAYDNKITTIIDVVGYSNLVTGEEYTVKGVLMDKSTGKPLLISGNEVTAERTFVAVRANGTVELEFTFDSSSLRGKEVVVFEYLYFNDREIASHADIEDKDQTVKFRDPQIGTTASEKNTGKKEIQAAKQVTIIDIVKYQDLILGKEYTVKGILMDKRSGKPLLTGGKEVTAEKTFKAEKENGSMKVDFTFDASGLKNKEVVVFEKLYYGSSEIAVHENIKDKAQTVKFVKADTTETTAPPKENTDSSKVTASPKTGDATSIFLYIVLVMISLGSLIAYLLKKGKLRFTIRK